LDDILRAPNFFRITEKIPINLFIEDKEIYFSLKKMAGARIKLVAFNALLLEVNLFHLPFLLSFWRISARN